MAWESSGNEDEENEGSQKYEVGKRGGFRGLNTLFDVGLQRKYNIL